MNKRFSQQIYDFYFFKLTDKFVEKRNYKTFSGKPR